MKIAETLRRLDRAIAGIAPTVPTVRKVRREMSAGLRAESPDDVFALAKALVGRDRGFDRFIAYELVAAHRATMAQLTAADLRALGKGMDSWDDVDAFASLVSGPAWRESRVSDADIAGWASSKDLWWRRAAVVSTVPLNNKARGGSGDPARTLAICGMVLDEREPMIASCRSGTRRQLRISSPNTMTVWPLWCAAK
jgi:AcrR family transcriptional regulator